MNDATLKLAVESVDNQLKNGRVCPNDTNGDGDCGRPACPVCGVGVPVVQKRRVALVDERGRPTGRVLEISEDAFQRLLKAAKPV